MFVGSGPMHVHVAAEYLRTFAHFRGIAAHHMGKEYVKARLVDLGSEDRLAALGVAQASRQPFPRLMTTTCILHRNGSDRGSKLEQEHRQAQNDKKEEGSCSASNQEGNHKQYWISRTVISARRTFGIGEAVGLACS